MTSELAEFLTDRESCQSHFLLGTHSLFLNLLSSRKLSIFSPVGSFLKYAARKKSMYRFKVSKPPSRNRPRFRSVGTPRKTQRMLPIYSNEKRNERVLLHSLLPLSPDPWPPTWRHSKSRSAIFLLNAAFLHVSAIDSETYSL